MTCLEEKGSSREEGTAKLAGRARIGIWAKAVQGVNNDDTDRTDDELLELLIDIESANRRPDRDGSIAEVRIIKGDKPARTAIDVEGIAAWELALYYFFATRGVAFLLFYQRVS